MRGAARFVAVFGGQGGVGKSFVAANLAVSLRQQQGSRVLLLDAGHPLPGATAPLVGLSRTKSAGDMVPLLDRFSPEAFADYVVSAACGVAVLPLIGDVLQARLITEPVVDRVIALAAPCYDFVVADLPPGLAPLTPHWLDRSDDVCLVAEPTAAGLLRARGALDYLRTRQVASEATLLCLNRADGAGVAGLDTLERRLGVRILASLPSDHEAVGRAAERGAPLVIDAPRHPIARALDRLARELATRRAQSGPARLPADTDGSAAGERIRRVKLEIHRRLIEEIDLRKADLAYLRDPVKLQEMRTRAEAKIHSLVEEEAAGLAGPDVRRQIVKDVLDEALGLGVLEDLLADADVTEIMVNHHDQIYVERKGRIELTPQRFLTPEQLRGVIERIVAPLGRRIDEKVPMVDARLRDGSRVNAIIPPLALRGPALTIRKFSRDLLGIDDLVRLDSLTEQMATFLSAAVQARLNVVISGGTGSGKTTLLNVLASFIPPADRIITIEDSAELRLPQEHVVSLESRPANIEGEGAITIRDLVRNALRMRPDRIVVGECRGGETLDMLQAMNTGHDGSLTTVHSNSPRDALSRLETMALMAGLDLPARAIRDQIAAAINLVIQQSRLQDGTRRITHVTEIAGQEAGVFTTADIFVFRQTGLAPDGRVYGQFVPTGHVPGFIETLSRRGLRVPREIFLHQTA